MGRLGAQLEKCEGAVSGFGSSLVGLVVGRGQESEEVRSAAAIALGRLASFTGASANEYLSAILSGSCSSGGQQYLHFTALRHCLEGVLLMKVL